MDNPNLFPEGVRYPFFKTPTISTKAASVTIYNSASFGSARVGFEPRNSLPKSAVRCCTDGTIVAVEGNLASKMTIGPVLHRSYH